jgi:hypothetical protein
MIAHHLATLAFRVLGLWAVIVAVAGHFPTFIGAFMMRERIIQEGGFGADYFILLLVPLVLYLIAGLLLWFFAEPLARRAIPKTTTASSALNPHNVQTVAFSVVGLYLLTQAVPDLVQLVSFYSLPGPAAVWTPGNLPGAGIRILFGLWLLLGSSGLVTALTKLRTSGLEKS